MSEYNHMSDNEALKSLVTHLKRREARSGPYGSSCSVGGKPRWRRYKEALEALMERMAHAPANTTVPRTPPPVQPPVEDRVTDRLFNKFVF